MQAHLSGGNDNVEAEKAEETQKALLRVGVKVEVIAQKGEAWFSGKIVDGDRIKGYDIEYDDGDKETEVRTDRIRLRTARTVGVEVATTVLAQVPGWTQHEATDRMAAD